MLRNKLRTAMAVLLAVLLAACGGTESADRSADGPPVNNQAVNPPTEVPFREAASRITRENASQLQQIGRLDAPGSETSTLFAHSFSPDGTRLAALNNSLLLNWDVTLGTLVFSTGRQGAVFVYYDADKTEIYTVDTGGVIQVYDAERGSVKTTMNGPSDFNGLNDFYADGDLLAMGAADGSVQVWQPSQRVSRATLRGQNTELLTLAFSEDGRLLGTAGRDGILRIWDWEAREIIAEFDHEGASVLRLAFSPSGDSVATSTSTYIASWDIETAELRFTQVLGEDNTGDNLLFSPDGRFLIVAGGPGSLRAFDPVTGDRLAELADVGGNRISISFSPGSDLMVTTVLDRAVSLWNMAEANEGTIPRGAINVASRRITSAAWTADGFLLAFFDASGPVYLWGIPAAN